MTLKQQDESLREVSDQLSASQQKRLLGTRLDATLEQVYRHKAWSFGLGLGDHLSPLKPAHVLDIADTNLPGMLRKLHFNDEIVKNPHKTPVYKKPCALLTGGLCHKAKHFAEVCGMVSALHAHFQQTKALESVPLCRFSWTPSCASASHAPCGAVRWCVLGVASKRPVAHVFARYYPVSGQKLQLMVEDGNPVITTSHRFLQSLCLEFEHQGNELSTFECVVALMKFWRAFFYAFVLPCDCAPSSSAKI